MMNERQRRRRQPSKKSGSGDDGELPLLLACSRVLLPSPGRQGQPSRRSRTARSSLGKGSGLIGPVRKRGGEEEESSKKKKKKKKWKKRRLGLLLKIETERSPSTRREKQHFFFAQLLRPSLNPRHARTRRNARPMRPQSAWQRPKKGSELEEKERRERKR